MITDVIRASQVRYLFQCDSGRVTMVCLCQWCACAGHVPVVFLCLSHAISGPLCPQKLSSLCKVVGKHYR